MERLGPFEPGSDADWTPALAAHLLRRGGFAPNPQELEQALGHGPRATVDRLIDGGPETPRAIELDAIGERVALGRDIAALRAWWLQRMRYTSRPLHARMALLWHDHFATSNEKVDSPALMLGQLRTIEQRALGRFGDLAGALARDPAMVIWLDGEQNIKGRPNENFARELLELFTLGVGAYTESDVREAARAFTGWRVRQGRTEFVPRLHDARGKTVLGRSGPLDGGDVIDAAMACPEAGRFIGHRLLRTFVTPDPDAELVDAVAARLRSTDFDVAETMRTLLASRAMFERGHLRTRIKSPVELTVGLVRSLDLSARGPELADTTDRLGQRLFEPPGVEGWEGERAWLTSTTMLLRLNTVTSAVGPDRLDAARLLDRLGAREPELIVRRLAALVLDDQVPASLQVELSGLSGPPERIVRAALRFLLSAPEYQLC